MSKSRKLTRWNFLTFTILWFPYLLSNRLLISKVKQYFLRFNGFISYTGSPNETQLGERIDYNEHFSWEWNQGRLGFGPFGKAAFSHGHLQYSRKL